MASLDTPNILGSYLQGAQAGREDRSRKALQDYLQPALAGDQNALSAIYKADPEAGMRAQIQGQRMSAQQAEELVKSGDARIAQLGKWARQLTTLPDDLKPGAYQRILPELQKEFPSNWPAQWSPDMAQKAQQLADTLDPQSKQDDQFTLSAGAKRFDRNGKLVAEAPFAPAAMQRLETDQGYAAWDPRTGVATPITYGNPQAQRTATSGENDRAAQLFQQAYDQAASQGMSDEQASAYAAQQVNGAMQPQGGGQQVRPVSKPEGNQFRALSAQEVQSLGLPAGTTAQMGSNGQISVINKPDTGASAKEQERLQTLESSRVQTQTAIDTIDSLLAAKGLGKAVGLRSAFPTIPGSDAANFEARLETFKAQTFIPMVSQLKGMGALSDAEGKKLSAAVGALDTSMSESEFRKSLGEVKTRLKDALDRAERQGAGQPSSGSSDINSLLDKYR